MKKQLQKYCQDALQIQDACNPVAIVNAWAGHLNNWRELGYSGWDDLEKDAPFILFLDKLDDLAGRPSRQNSLAYSRVFDACKAITEAQTS